MDTAFLVTDYAERGARFLKRLATSPLGPARVAYWRRRDVGWDDEPGDWTFVVALGGEAGSFDGDVRQTLSRVAAEMNCPNLGMYSPTIPRESDPVPAAAEAFGLCGDRPRWVSQDELAGRPAVSGGGLYLYPASMLGAADLRQVATPADQPPPQSAPLDGKLTPKQEVRRRRLRREPVGDLTG